MKKVLLPLLTTLLLIGVTAAAFVTVRQWFPSRGNPADKQAVRAAVTGFGKRLQLVSVLAPADQAAQAIQDSYAAYVAPGLLTQWKNDPGNAPGKLTSSPWPDRIEISNVAALSNTRYQVDGKVIEITSVEAASGGVAASRSVRLIVERIDGQWLITSVQFGDYDPR
jgi:hypothetical protein